MSKKPVQGFDVSVLVMGATGPSLAGEYQEVEFSVKNDTENYLELGERIAQILDGEISIEGKLKRGWVSMDVVESVFGTSTLRRGEEPPESPRFVVITTIKNAAKGLSGRYKFEQVVIPEISISVSAGKGVIKKDLTFKAEGLVEA